MLSIIFQGNFSTGTEYVVSNLVVKCSKYWNYIFLAGYGNLLPFSMRLYSYQEFKTILLFFFSVLSNL